MQQAAKRDRQHEQVDQQQVQRKHPGGTFEVRFIDVLDHHHLELTRQEHHRQHCQQRQREPLLVGELLTRLLRQREQRLQFGRGPRAREDVGRPVEQAPGHEGAHRDEGDELDDRLERDRGHHAFVFFGAVQVARAEHHREAGQCQREVEGAVAPPGQRCGQRRAQRRGEQRVAAGHRLQLQRNVGHDTDHGDQRHRAGQQPALAVAAADEVGDGGDAVRAGDADHLANHQPGQHHRQRRAEVDRQEPDPAAGSAAHAAEVRPGGAVDRQRQRIDPGVADHRTPLPRACIGERGHREQQQQVGERRSDDERGREHEQAQRVSRRCVRLPRPQAQSGRPTA